MQVRWQAHKQTADLKRIREEISFDASPLRKTINSKSFKVTFGELRGEQVKTSSKGYAADNDAIDLLRFKQLLLIRNFTDKEVFDKNFVNELNYTIRQMRPFLDYMSEVLTTDTNGLMK